MCGGGIAVVAAVSVDHAVRQTDLSGIEASPERLPESSPTPRDRRTITEGTWTIGTDVEAGTYRTAGAGPDCYWSITRSNTNGSDIVENHIGGGNLTVVLKTGQDFETARCGAWAKVG